MLEDRLKVGLHAPAPPERWRGTCAPLLRQAKGVLRTCPGAGPGRAPAQAAGAGAQPEAAPGAAAGGRLALLLGSACMLCSAARCSALPSAGGCPPLSAWVLQAERMDAAVKLAAAPSPELLQELRRRAAHAQRATELEVGACCSRVHFTQRCVHLCPPCTAPLQHLAWHSPQRLAVRAGQAGRAGAGERRAACPARRGCCSGRAGRAAPGARAGRRAGHAAGRLKAGPRPAPTPDSCSSSWSRPWMPSRWGWVQLCALPADPAWHRAVTPSQHEHHVAMVPILKRCCCAGQGSHAEQCP